MTSEMVYGDLQYNRRMGSSTDIKNKAIEEASLARASEQKKLGLDGTSPAGVPFNDAASLNRTQPLPPESPGTPPRTTSFAKTLDGGYVPPDNANLKTNPVEQGRGSEMVEKDQPKPELTPSDSPEKRAVDADKFNKAWSTEQAKADAALREAREAAAEIRGEQGQSGQSRENNRDPGMG